VKFNKHEYDIKVEIMKTVLHMHIVFRTSIQPCLTSMQHSPRVTHPPSKLPVSFICKHCFTTTIFLGSTVVHTIKCYSEIWLIHYLFVCFANITSVYHLLHHMWQQQRPFVISLSLNTIRNMQNKLCDHKLITQHFLPPLDTQECTVTVYFIVWSLE
jgi:hypothetical protein